MSILIRNMKMPKNGKYILCSIRSDGRVITELITGGCEVYEAIELPPHGDLIDRDALFFDIGESVVFSSRSIGEVSNNPSEIRGANKIIDRINVAPTVIDRTIDIPERGVSNDSN